MVEKCFQIIKSEGTPCRDCLCGVPSPEQTVRIASKLQQKVLEGFLSMKDGVATYRVHRSEGCLVLHRHT
jgi:hypothetical protein